MPLPESSVRLTIIGPKHLVRQFIENEHWGKTLGVRYLDWLELFPTRRVCEFTTYQTPAKTIAVVSKAWPKLAFLLDYETQRHRIKGLIVAKSGQLEDCAINY